MANNPVRGEVLQQAMDATLKTRHEVYGDPYTDMNCAAEFERIYRAHAGDKYCQAHDEAIRRVLMKLARIACGAPGHLDSYVDLAAYVAIAAECQAAADEMVRKFYPYTQAGCAAPGSEVEVGAGTFYMDESGMRSTNPKTDAAIRAIMAENKTAASADAMTAEEESQWDDLMKKQEQRQQPDDTQMQTAGPLLDPQTVELKTGMQFRTHEGKWPIWEVIEVFSVGEGKQIGRFRAKLVLDSACHLPDTKIVQHMSIRAIAEILPDQPKTAGYRCIHCPDDAVPGKQTCEDCDTGQDV